MAINRYMNRRPFQGSLYAPPVDTITAALEMAQQQYNTNFAAAEELRNRYIDSLSQDRARADEKQAEYDSRIDEVVAKYNGDYSQATKDLYSLTKQIEKDFNPGGEAWAIQQSKIAWTEATKRNQERLKNGKITAPQINLLENWMKTTYTGTKKQEDGTYSILEVPELVDYVKAEDIAAKAAKEVPKRTRVTTEPVYKNGRWFTDYKKDEYIDPKDMEQAISSALVQDDKYVQYVSQMSALTGIGFDEILGSSVKTFSERFVNTHAGTLYDEDSVNYKGVDALYLESVKQRNRKDMEDYKNKQAAEAGMGTQISLLGTAENLKGKFKEVNLEGELHFDPKSPMYYSRYLPTVDEAMQRGDEFNTQILGALKSSMPNASLRDVWDAYNRSIKLDNYSKGVYYHKFETTAAQNEEADRMLPRLKAGAAKAYVLNTDTGRVEPASDREIRAFYNDNYDPVKRKATTTALGKTSPQSGNVPFGTVFPTSSGNGYFIIAENEERMNQFNENTRHAAFGWLQTDAIEGTPFDIATENGPMTISGHKQYVYDQSLDAVVPDVKYYQVIDQSTGNRYVRKLSDTPLTYNGIPWTPAHVEQALIGNSMSDYNPKRPKTATKEYNNTIE